MSPLILLKKNIGLDLGRAQSINSTSFESQDQTTILVISGGGCYQIQRYLLVGVLKNLW
jgi:hypothetical protein